MNTERYQTVITETMQKSLNTLTDKAKEYARKEDMFHNFEVAAVLKGETREEALFGFMDKNLVSISDMVPNAGSYTQEKWQEKIGDTINYLLILSAMVSEYAD